MAAAAKSVRIEALTSLGIIYLDHIEVLNIGGEGEVADAINLNNLESTIRSLVDILNRGPLIKADMRKTGLPDGSVGAVIGNMVPLGDQVWMLEVATEQLRVLKAKGMIRIASWRSPELWADALRRAGFEEIEIESGYARGTKP